MKINITKLVILTFILLFIFNASFVVYSLVRFKAKKNICSYLDTSRYGRDVDFRDCFSIYSIERDNICDCYTFRDDKHNYGLASIKSLKQYKILNGYIYLYEPLLGSPDDYTSVKFGDNPRQFPMSYFIDGQVKEINYNSIEEFPQYLQVEYSTGEVTLYNTYDQMPDNVKPIFQALENNAKK